MRLNTYELTRLARKLGYRNGRDMLVKIKAIGDCAYTPLKKFCDIGYNAVKQIYNAVGEQATARVIDFGSGGIRAFENKFLKVGNGLY